MRQKLKQYIGLVGQAEHGGGEQPTKVEDLQGFWDMVYFQVEDILKKFQGLESLEKNNWQAEQDLEPVAKKRKVSYVTFCVGCDLLCWLCDLLCWLCDVCFRLSCALDMYWLCGVGNLLCWLCDPTLAICGVTHLLPL